MDASGWDDRYAAAELVWSAGPNQTVARELGDLSPGTALDLAAGEGRNALWLAERGWRVTAVDFSAVGLIKAQRAAEHRGVPLTTVVTDLLQYRPEHRFDLVLLAYLQLPWPQLQKVLAMAAGALAPGGTLLLVSHDLQNLTDGVGGPQDPTVLQTPEHVAGALPGLTIDHDGRIRRPVEVDGGSREAIDTLVRASRPTI
jgi:SAM-dependent methyltransferase